VAARHLLLDLAGVLCGFDSTARLEGLATVSRFETAESDERLYGSGIVDRWPAASWMPSAFKACCASSRTELRQP
jgi:hypothetical protein